MGKYFELDIITPDNIFYKGHAVDINCETTDGRYEILPGHSPVIAGIVKTTTRIKDAEGKELSVLTGKGFLKATGDHVVLLCDDAQWKDK